MIKRYQLYTSFVKHQRKIFSEVQKRVIASRQGYRCWGEVCKGQFLLPETWELDHIQPLYAGGTNFYNFHPEFSRSITDRESCQDPKNNVHILCSACHALKTQHEKVSFFAEERKQKYNECVEFLPAQEYYQSSVEINPLKSLTVSPYFTEGHVKQLKPFNFDKFKYNPT